jgi:N-acetylglucosamine-6-phosphate deacetylase
MKQMAVIRHATIYTPDGVIADGAVRTAGERIAAVGPDAVVLEHSDDMDELDGHGLLLIPGLIDLQCNGLCGHDVLDGDPQVLRALAASLPAYGCTAVLPTVITAPTTVLTSALRAIAEVTQVPTGGAIVLGAHMEGPWLSPAHHGAHRLDLVRPFDRGELEALLEAAQGTLQLVTLAPEVPGNEDAVLALASRDILVSLGHSGAGYEEALAAVRQGARMATHLFNAMGPLLHRAPGLPGAALTLPELVPGIIPDGYHVHPAIVRLATRARGPHGLALVTDSVPVAGMAPGTYQWQGRAVRWDGETVRLEGGGLAGSGLTPIEALRRYIEFTGLSLAEALPAMTSTPARLIGQDGERGAIVPGARADLVLLTQDLLVHTTLVGGDAVYRS